MTTQEIVTNHQTEIIPKLQFDSPLENALVTNDTFTPKLLPLKGRAQELKKQYKEMRERGVRYDAQVYADFGAVLSEVRSIRKNEVVALWTPFLSVVERVRDFLKTKRQQAENLCEEIDEICRAEMKTLEVAEKQATAQEQKQVDKSNPGATVKPNIPSVAGYRQSGVIYRATLEDRSKFLNAFLRGDKKTKQFLGQFLVIDEQELSKYYRDKKDEAQKIPGVKFSKG